jgi:hypothetical protein
MKKHHKILAAALLILAFLVSACTRSASSGPSDAPSTESTLPNPVSTQSQLMKEIIAGTQTAMAAPLDATDTEPDAEDAGDSEAKDTEPDATPEPEEEEPTAVPLPTSTPGPAPEVALEYNTKKCGPNVYICIVDYTKDQTVTVQATYPWLLDDMDLIFKMGPDGVYDYSTYIVAGTAKYEPDGSKGYGFKAILTIPDSLRGTETIVVRLETNNPTYIGYDFFSNN